MKNKKNLIILIIIAVLIIGGITGYTVYEMKQDNKEVKEDDSSKNDANNGKEEEKEDKEKLVKVTDYNKSLGDLLGGKITNKKITVDYGNLVTATNGEKINVKLILDYSLFEGNTDFYNVFIIINDKQYEYSMDKRLKNIETIKILPFKNTVLVINNANQYTMEGNPEFRRYDSQGLISHNNRIVTKYNKEGSEDILDCPIEVKDDTLRYCEYNDQEIVVGKIQSVNSIEYKDKNDFKILENFRAYLNEQRS